MYVRDDGRCSTGSVRYLSIDQQDLRSLHRSLTLPVLQRRSRHFPVYAVAKCLNAPDIEIELSLSLRFSGAHFGQRLLAA